MQYFLRKFNLFCYKHLKNGVLYKVYYRILHKEVNILSITHKKDSEKVLKRLK